MRKSRTGSPGSIRNVLTLVKSFRHYLGFGSVGAVGEECAARYLGSTRARVWCRNWTCRFGEIDIIALRPRCIVFVEVKTRMKGPAGRFSARDALTSSKTAQIEKLIDYFMSSNRLSLRRMKINRIQIDFIAVTCSRTSMGRLRVNEVEHFEAVPSVERQSQTR